MKSIISLLSSALFQTGEFTVIDVSERERLLQELEFSMSDCTDESCLREVGRMLSAEGIAAGNLGLGVLPGVQYQATKKDARYLYTMLTVPLGAEVSYRAKSMLPFFLSGSVSGGVTLNGILYKEEYLFRDNTLNLSAFAAPGVGLGHQLSPKTSLALTARLMMILFQGSLYLGASPTFGVDIRL